MLFSLVLVGGCLLIGCCFWISSRKYRHYPGLGVPVIGDLYQAATSYTSSMTKLVKQADAGFDSYGDTYCKRHGPIIMLFTADAHLIQELAVHPFMANKEPLIYNNLRPFLKGPFSSAHADKQWKNERKLIQEAMKKNYLEEYHDIFVRRSLELVEALEKRSGELDVQPLVMLLALDVSSEALASYHSTYLYDNDFSAYRDFQRLNSEVMSRILSLGLNNMGKNYLKKYTHIFKLKEKTLEIIMRNIEQKDRKLESGTIPLLECLMCSLMEDGISKEDVVPYVIESFAESFYTNGIILSGALLFLALYPQVQENAWAEQNDIFAGSSECPKYAEVKKMVYLERVVKEATRLLGPPALARRSSGNIKIGNHFVPKNSTVVYAFFRIRKDSRYWKTPKLFNPDHFLPEAVSARPRGAYLGFGTGVRNCPGYQFGINFNKVVLSTVIRKFKLTSPLKASDLEFEPSLFMTLKGPHTIRLEPRHF